MVGNGPAGLAAAAACAGVGLAVTVLAPDHSTGWPNTYGVWEDELAPLGLEDVYAVRWPQIGVAFDDDAVAGPPVQVRHLPRAYGLVDNESLRDRLLQRCRAGGAAFVTGHADGLDAGPVVTTAEGEQLAARCVVDASGHRPALLSPPEGGPTAFQAAYGVVGRFTRPPIPPGTMMLMDYRAQPLDGLPGVATEPTFLYAMDLGGGRFFVEETSLARRAPLPFEALETRLHRRLERTGAALTQSEEVERVVFPMGGPLPSTDQPVIGYGGAARMVHPATGYQVGTALHRAPALATALRAALAAPHATPGSIAQAGWAAVWPEDRIRQRQLHEFGLEVLLSLDTARTQAFFGAFFGLPVPAWREYVSGAPSVRAVARTMLRLFAVASPQLRLALGTSALRPAGLQALRALA